MFEKKTESCSLIEISNCIKVNKKKKKQKLLLVKKNLSIKKHYLRE